MEGGTAGLMNHMDSGSSEECTESRDRTDENVTLGIVIKKKHNIMMKIKTRTLTQQTRQQNEY